MLDRKSCENFAVEHLFQPEDIWQGTVLEFSKRRALAYRVMEYRSECTSHRSGMGIGWRKLKFMKSIQRDSEITQWSKVDTYGFVAPKPSLMASTIRNAKTFYVLHRTDPSVTRQTVVAG